MRKILLILLVISLLFPYQAFATNHTIADRVINTAKQFIGTPYQFGAPLGNTASFDCSSFSAYVFAQHGITLPRVSRDQARTGVAVSRNNLQKGDLVFYDTNFDGQINHLGIYINETQMIHASTSNGVIIAPPFNTYWGPRYVTARRVIPEQAVVNPNQSIYTVKSGDTLFHFARDFNSTVQQLRDWNNLTSDIIHVGQVLHVKAPTSQQQAITNQSVHTVVQGDTLWIISRTYNVSVDQIIQWNSLSTSTIHVGQRLAVAPITKTYVVQSGDTLWRIATNHGMTVQQLTDLNGLNSTTIHPGQVLKVQ